MSRFHADVRPERHAVRPVNVERLSCQQAAGHFPRLAGWRGPSHGRSLSQPRLSLLRGLLSPSIRNRSSPSSYSSELDVGQAGKLGRIGKEIEEFDGVCAGNDPRTRACNRCWPGFWV